jgi:membrane-bound metal-dependent hydrolase YbcI (DUF457 family)
MAVGMEHGAVTRLDFAHGLQYLEPPAIQWSHGLFMTVVWSLVAAAIAFIFSRERRTSIAIGLMVFSHWALDFIVYFYMPLFFDNSQTIGLGLITTVPGLIVGILLEVILIGGGIIFYLVTRKRIVVSAS